MFRDNHIDEYFASDRLAGHILSTCLMGTRFVCGCLREINGRLRRICRISISLTLCVREIVFTGFLLKAKYHKT